MEITPPLISACAAVGSLIVAALSLRHSLRTAKLAKTQELSIKQLAHENVIIREAVSVIARTGKGGNGGSGGAGGKITILGDSKVGTIHSAGGLGGAGGSGGNIVLSSEARTLLNLPPEDKK